MTKCISCPTFHRKVIKQLVVLVSSSANRAMRAKWLTCHTFTTFPKLDGCHVSHVQNGRVVSHFQKKHVQLTLLSQIFCNFGIAERLSGHCRVPLFSQSINVHIVYLSHIRLNASVAKWISWYFVSSSANRAMKLTCPKWSSCLTFKKNMFSWLFCPTFFNLVLSNGQRNIVVSHFAHIWAVSKMLICLTFIRTPMW